MTLSLSTAQSIVAGALEAARTKQAKPLAVAVVDAGGHLIAFAREDGATIFRHHIALAKARGVVGMGDDTRVLADRAKSNPLFFQSLSGAVDGNIAFSPGGVAVRDAGGSLLGAVGISGDTGDVDEECALAGLTREGLQGEGR
ncbi:GlcG/HbpS family heme-binding protein [Sphingobium bisphenolivorans]|uniref:GlcG/HbpS family heme-binding protein n=1 Tax=Sphingobium bisphenolivorans TaxID=1335760 RepID=UPI000399F25B|nr:heme-binding protein [Sphingobium bisphenolivorans]